MIHNSKLKRFNGTRWNNVRYATCVYCIILCIKKPYAEAANNFYNKSRTTSTQTNTRDNRDIKTIASSDGQKSSYSQTTAKTRYNSRRARTGATKASQQGRALYASSNKLIKGDM